MGRRPRIKDETIISAAREVFLERGLKATTAEVAERAGVSEGSLFNRFETKAGLFRAAMLPEIEEPKWLDNLTRQALKGDLRRNLYEAGIGAIVFFRGVMPLMMMLWSSREHAGLPEEMTKRNSPPIRDVKRLVAFLRAEMRSGRIRRQDPEIMARVFLGAIENYVFLEVLFQAQGRQAMPAETYVHGLVDLLWTGAAPVQ